MMTEDFFLRALGAGLGLALVMGPLGCFVVWRRMAFFGATVAHAALPGVALGLLLGVDPFLGAVGAAVAVTLALVLARRQRHLTTDTLLGILAHAFLAIGLIMMGLMEHVRMDLLGYLFGDILAVTVADLVWIWGGGAASLVVLAMLWRPLLAITVNEEVARAEGVAVARVDLAFMLLIALVIALAMKIVGILLAVSLLVIPAATARRFAATPERMAAVAAVAGVLSVMGGLWVSARWDTPSGPALVAVAFVLFLLGSLWRRPGS